MEDIKRFLLHQCIKHTIELFVELNLNCKYKDGFLFTTSVLSMNELLLIDSIATENKCKFKIIASKKNIVIQFINFNIEQHD